MRKLAFVVTMVLLAANAGAASYRIDWASVNCGGGHTGGAAFSISFTVGQPAAGSAGSAGLLHWIGFWAGDAISPIVVESIAEAKLLPDGTLVSISDRIATTDAGDFEEFFYVEDTHRTSGIRVDVPPSTVSGLARGSLVSVTGTLGSTIYGERQLLNPVVSLTP